MFNQVDKELPLTNVMLREGNLLVMVWYEMRINDSTTIESSVAKPRGQDLAKYVYEVVTAAP